MMFEGEDSSVMMTKEDETQHKGSEETEKPNKSSHGNEVKYFMQYNAAISIFSPFKLFGTWLMIDYKGAKAWSIPHKRNSCHKTKNKTRKSSFFEIETTWTQRLFEYSTLKHMKRGVETLKRGTRVSTFRQLFVTMGLRLRSETIFLFVLRKVESLQYFSHFQA